MARVVAFRDPGADDRFYDMDVRALQWDPFEEVRGLYAWLGEPVTEDLELGMARWWQENAEHREQNVHPDPSTFGLDLDEVSGRFGDCTPRMAAYTAASRQGSGP